MRRITCLLLLVAPLAAQGGPLPRDVAAVHPEGKWKIRKADLYRYLARYESKQPAALAVLPEYLKLRLVEDEARRRKVSVTEAEVEAWLKELDERIRREGQRGGLDAMRREVNMRKEELRRKGRQWLLQEKVARAILKEKDPSRPDGPVAEDSVIFVIDTLYKDAPKETEGLPDGVIARIRGIDITEYEYGRALAVELPATDVLRALRSLILEEEVALLVGDREPPSKAELEEQKQWFLDIERNRLSRLPDAPRVISDELIEQVLNQRGLSMEMVVSNPAFLAQARAVGHFRRTLTEKDLRRYHEGHPGRYGDQARIARILVGARGQDVPGVGRPIRTMKQGKALADDLYERLRAGQDFRQLARERSEDPDNIRKGGGVVPFWINADTPGYQDSFQQAVQLEPNGISRPFWSQGRGYVIVRLLDLRKGLSYAQLEDVIRRDAARDAYALWRNERSRAARVNEQLLELEE